MVASDTTAVAFYEIRFCKIQVSSIPVTDVPVTGAQSGETEYEFIVDYDQEVTLTAPLQVEQETIRYNFVRWMLVGKSSRTARQLSFSPRPKMPI